MGWCVRQPRVQQARTTYEWANTIREVGAGLSLWPNAVKALDTLELGAAIREFSVPQLSGAIRSADGATLVGAAQVDLEARFGAPTVIIHRAALLDLLRDQLPAEAIQLGARLTSLATERPTVAAHFADGRVAHSDVLIGADGLHSAVREQLWGAVPPRYAGYTAWRGVVRPATPLTDDAESWPGRMPGDRGCRGAGALSCRLCKEYGAGFFGSTLAAAGVLFSLFGLDPCDQIRQQAEVGKLIIPALIGWRRFGGLVRPGQLVGHIHRAAAKFQHRQNIRAHRVADHDESFWGDAVAPQQTLVVVAALVADDLDMDEMLGQTRLGNLQFLVAQIAFCDDHELVRLRQLCQRIGHIFQQLDLGCQHGPGQINDCLYVVTSNAPFGQFHCCFDHRQRERFDAIAKMLQIAHLGLVQTIFDPFRAVVLR